MNERGFRQLASQRRVAPSRAGEYTRFGRHNLRRYCDCRVPMQEAEYEVMHDQELVHWWFSGRRVLLERLLQRHLPAVRSPAILDFGCGTGGNALAYAAFGPVVGIEPDRNALRFAKSRSAAARAYRITYCRAVGTALPLRSGTFDVVVASDVLEHIADHEAAAREIARVLKPGGVLVFSVPAHPWLWSSHDEALWHQRRYRRADLLRLLASAGLEVHWLSYWNAVLFPAIALRRVLAPAPRGPVRLSDATLPPAFINRALTRMLRLEARLLDWIRFPFGVSLVGVAGRDTL
jgi:SAM-dependent methyltransferase